MQRQGGTTAGNEVEVIRMVGESTEAVGAGVGGGSSGNKMPTLEEYGTSLTKMAEELAELFSKDGMSFLASCQNLVPRPWVIDDLDAFILKWGRKSWKKVVIFVDNSGADTILGILPFARELLRRGMQVFLEMKGIQLPNPFPRLTYAEAMSQYGSDRPDARFDLELRDVSDIFTDSFLKVFTDTLASGGIIKVLCVPLGSKSNSNTALKKGDIFNEAIKSGVKGLPFLKVLNDGDIEGIPALVSSLDPTKMEQLLTRCSAGSGDLVLFALGHYVSVNKTLDRLRVYVAHELGLIDQSRHSILWVIDFPMFEWNSLEQRLKAFHHPSTAPNPEDMKDLSSAHALAYDMVYNRVEIGGGSLRIYKREIQEKVLEIVGISPEQAEAKFGYLLEALDIGAPPHGVNC